jgi:hypothetical protein
MKFKGHKNFENVKDFEMNQRFLAARAGLLRMEQTLSSEKVLNAFFTRTLKEIMKRFNPFPQPEISLEIFFYF